MCKKEGQGGCRKGHDVKPGDCTPERIQECHGDQPCHPCETHLSDCSPNRIRECLGPDAGHPCEQD
jgi:hypothetical protein